MKFFSTNGQSPEVDFKEATIRGMAPDKGLYFPQTITRLPAAYMHQLGALSKESIAFDIIKPYIGDCIPDKELERIVAETVDFDFPLVPVADNIYSLELFHGPTLAFKDVGARFMSRCLGYFSRKRKGTVVVLVATSGDTGGAVANGFDGVEGVEVVILYPSGKVSSVQEKQLTTLGNSIHALEVAGTFDDCQRMVKQAFADASLNEKLFLTSANSINVARWLPQQFYYFFALQQWMHADDPPVISVPSGNFGNICAGLLANRTGLPVAHFIAACNANDTVPAYLRSGDYQPKPAVATMSNAMDVGNPSNFVRIMELFEHQRNNLAAAMSSCSISDRQTRETIQDIYKRFDYLLDPHGAVGFLALKEYLGEHPGRKGIFLETAHPVKFFDVVEPVIGESIPLPPPVEAIMQKEKRSVNMSTDYEELQSFLGKM